MLLDPTQITVTANIAGQSYNLNDGNRIRLELFDLGMAPARRIFQRAPAQNGRSNLSGLTQERYANLAWTLQGVDLIDFYSLRETFQVIWRMRRTLPVQLVFSFPNGAVRAMDLFLDGQLLFDDRAHTRTRVGGTFVADDPRLYDPTVIEEVFQLDVASGGLPIPFTIPIPIGQSTINATSIITYAGGSRLASEEFPVITLDGPMTNPVITNLTTEEVLDFTANGGLSIGAGESVTIDLSGGARRDSKTIRNQDGDSVSQFLTADSDIGTFHLAYAGEALPDGTFCDGDNEFQVEADGVNVNTQTTIRYYNRYEGI
jgi:hypothetical protein